MDAQKAVMVQRGQVVRTQNTSVCSENVSFVFSYWLFSIQSYKISNTGQETCPYPGCGQMSHNKSLNNPMPLLA